MFRLLLSVLLLIPLPLLANETEVTVTETFNDQQINTDIDILYGGNQIFERRYLHSAFKIWKKNKGSI